MQQLMMNPPGPTRIEVISQLEADKERMHSEIQELSSKLHLTGKSAEKMTEKSAKYKKVQCTAVNALT